MCRSSWYISKTQNQWDLIRYCSLYMIKAVSQEYSLDMFYIWYTIDTEIQFDMPKPNSKYQKHDGRQSSSKRYNTKNTLFRIIDKFIIYKSFARLSTKYQSFIKFKCSNDSLSFKKILGIIKN
jgi:hypothetical protein